ncbi:MAG: spore coat protein CotJB [Lachnospiraceae bacterium]
MSSQSSSVPCRKDLMNKINLVSFAVNDATLFLDTHPNDADALAYFQKYRQMRVDALKEYEKHYAPLLLDVACDSSLPWSWVKEPWPWEGGDC